MDFCLRGKTDVVQGGRGDWIPASAGMTEVVEREEVRGEEDRPAPPDSSSRSLLRMTCGWEAGHRYDRMGVGEERESPPSQSSPVKGEEVREEKMGSHIREDKGGFGGVV